MCRAARQTPERARPRTQSSVAVSADGQRWFLLNASPDVREQLGRLAAEPGASIRHSPVEGIVLSDAELDHSLGVVLLREARALTVYATTAVRGILERDSRLLPTTRAFSTVAVTELPCGRPVALRYRDGAPSGLTVEAFPVPSDPPRFASADEPGHTVGLLIRDAAVGSSLAFVPGCGEIDDALLARLRAADAVLFDGTFWDDEELRTLGISEKTAREIGHLPINGAGGSLEQLATLPSETRVYTHVNNTNPILLEDSRERRLVRAAGIAVAHDGMRLTV
jgi:pyrroloquinoline quinone biosynthesis protein B